MEERGPWKIKGSEAKYKNPWIEVREDQVIRPDGKDGIFGVLEQSPGISVLALDDENNAHLVNEFRYALNRYSLETVSGGIEEGEQALDAAKRELREETGIEARDWKSFGVLEPLSSVVHCPQELFLARDLSFVPREPEGTELIEIRTIPFSEVVAMVMRNDIFYGPSCTLVLKVHEFLRLE